MDSLLTVAVPCRADEPGLAEALESLFAACQPPQLPPGLGIEVVICINGPGRGEGCLARTAVRDFCACHQLMVKEVWFNPVGPEEISGPLSEGQDKWLGCTVLLTEQAGKPRAWNLLRRWARGDVVLFCDADVRVEKDAVRQLYARLLRDPQLHLVAAREVPSLRGGGTLWSRMGGIPYRFDFGNAGGRLYLIRRDTLPGEMPTDLLLEDAWLTVAVGRHRVAKELRARVFFLPPATWRDYFAERVRTEGGKLQLRRVHRALLAGGPVAQYGWSQFWREIGLREYPLVLLALSVRGLARAWAWVALTRRDFYSLYRPFYSTKGWSQR